MWYLKRRVYVQLNVTDLVCSQHLNSPRLVSCLDRKSRNLRCLRHESRLSDHRNRVWKRFWPQFYFWGDGVSRRERLATQVALYKGQDYTQSLGKQQAFSVLLWENYGLQTTDREHRLCFSPAAVVTHAFSSRGHLKYQSAASHMRAEHPCPKECTREGQDYCPHLYKSVSVP